MKSLKSKVRKAEKARKRHADWKKRDNIMKSQFRQHLNGKRRRPSMQFPKSRKFKLPNPKVEKNVVK